MDKADIRSWLQKNTEVLMSEERFTSKDLDHIAVCMDHIHQWYYEDYPIGRFLTAVVRNDFTEACFQADSVNKRALYLYAMFLANKLPIDYRRKAKDSLNSAKIKGLTKG